MSKTPLAFDVAASPPASAGPGTHAAPPASAGARADGDAPRPPEPPPGSAPPYPFRTSPWYDPAVHQREQQGTARRALGPRRRVAAFVLVILGGVALPLAALLVNHALEQVLALGPVGTALLCAAVIATLANLLLLPTRKVDGQVVLHRAPRSGALCALLLAGALLSALFWGYLSLLFLPLAPISVVAIAFFGLGLCGLCPHGALAIGIVQSMRAGRVVHGRLGRGATVGVVAAALAVPLLVAGGAGLWARAGQARLELALGRIAATAPHGTERMRLIATLAGEEERVRESYRHEEDSARRRTLAEVYHRITDEPLTGDLYRVRNNTLIRPWWFTEQRGSPLSFGPFEFLPGSIFGGSFR